MKSEITDQVTQILAKHMPSSPTATADALRTLWLQHTPKSMEGIKAEQRAQQETIGIPVPVLKAIGQDIGKVARKQVNEYLLLAQYLWNDYGREGRVVAVHILGMELAKPERLIPQIITLCRTCITWEDADQLAMYALEPIVRKKPEIWLPTLETHIKDDNKWVRRACITVAGRLAMKNGIYTPRCLALAEQVLLDEETDVKARG
ncbi:MAG: DNA alkylation repair protein [Anaerolineae bacterium]|nr:DNA alkylation repair protein [Anaerolineae bacterium]